MACVQCHSRRATRAAQAKKQVKRLSWEVASEPALRKLALWEKVRRIVLKNAKNDGYGRSRLKTPGSCRAPDSFVLRPVEVISKSSVRGLASWWQLWAKIMRSVRTLYGDTTMVVSLSVVLAEASRNVFAELPSSSESRLDPYYARPG